MLVFKKRPMMICGGRYFVTARLDLNSKKVECVGKGDDGRVLKVENGNETTAVKVIRKEYSSGESDCENKVMGEIARDQAYREFKALKIIGSHRNFLQLLSEELDECEVHEVYEGQTVPNDTPLYTAWAIRVSFEENLVSIKDASRAFGVDLGDDGVRKFNLQSHCSLMKFINFQLLSVLDCLIGLKIRHRDLDDVNVKIRMPEMLVKVFDFARADLPSVDGLEETVCPNELISKAKREFDRQSELFEHISDEDEKFQDPNYAIAVERHHHFRMAYLVPDSMNPRYYMKRWNEPTDFDMLKRLVEKGLFPDGILSFVANESLMEFIDYHAKITHLIGGVWLQYTTGSLEHDLALLEPKGYESGLCEALSRMTVLFSGYGHMSEFISSVTRSRYKYLVDGTGLSETDAVNTQWNEGPCDIDTIKSNIVQINSCVDDINRILDGKSCCSEKLKFHRRSEIFAAMDRGAPFLMYVPDSMQTLKKDVLGFRRYLSSETILDLMRKAHDILRLVERCKRR